MLKHPHLSVPMLLMAMALAPAVLAEPDSVDPRIGQVLSQLAKVQPVEAVAISPDVKQLVWVIENQWKGRTPQIAYDWLKGWRGLIPLGHYGSYQLFRLAS